MICRTQLLCPSIKAWFIHEYNFTKLFTEYQQSHMKVLEVYGSKAQINNSIQQKIENNFFRFVSNKSLLRKEAKSLYCGRLNVQKF